MIKKIISGGQTEAERAALDAAINLNIPHGGWIPKGRITEKGPLPATYKLQEIPSSSRVDRIEQNVIDSDGTLILSHGTLIENADDILKMVEKHRRPWIHIDLDITAPLDAVLKIRSWIVEETIEVLNVGGTNAGEDQQLYEKTKEIVEGTICLIQIYDKGKDLKNLSAETMVPKTVSDAVDRLMDKLSLKDKTTIANMTADELNSLNITLGEYIAHFFRLTAGNEELMASCRFVSKKDVANEDAASMVIITELWEKLRKTHRLKVVK